MKRLLVAVALVGCAKQPPASKLSAADRDAAIDAAKQCVEAAGSLAPEYQMVGPKLAAAIKLDRNEAQRLMRDSIELLIATRELLCNVSQAAVDHALEIDPHDEPVASAALRLHAAKDHLREVRTAYDALLGATSAASAPVDQDAMLQRMQHALLGP